MKSKSLFLTILIPAFLSILSLVGCDKVTKEGKVMVLIANSPSGRIMNTLLLLMLLERSRYR